MTRTLYSRRYTAEQAAARLRARLPADCRKLVYTLRVSGGYALCAYDKVAGLGRPIFLYRNLVTDVAPW